MVSTFTVNKNIELAGHNDYVDTWDTPTNANWSLVDKALGNSVSKNATGLSGNQTLSTSDYQNLTINITGVPIGATTYVVPTGVGGMWVFINNTTGGQTIGIKSNAGGSTVTVAESASAIVSCDGSATGMRMGTTTSASAAGSNTQIQFNSSGVLGASANLTFSSNTLTTVHLSITGNTTIGNAGGDTITINAATASIPNGLNIGSNNLYLSGTQVGIGTSTLAGGNLLTVAGNIKITTGGLVFSDGTSLISASALAPGGASGDIQYNNGAGGFGAEAAFNYNAGSNTLSVTNLTLGNPLPVAQGGTGTASAATGTGGIVKETSPTIAGLTMTGTPTAPTAAFGTNTTQVATAAFANAAAAAVNNTLRQQVFTTTGAGTFTCTFSGRHKITVTGGGANGSSGGAAFGGAGGTAGSTAIYYADLVATTVYNLTVGAAATASTFVNGVTTVTGGAGGSPATNGSINISGGNGSTVGSGDGVTSFGTGGTGGASFWGGGGAGGPGAASPGSGGPGDAGLAFGSGGGGGGASDGSVGAGGAGKQGIVLVEWVGSA